jgi:hypothetical protein
MRYWVYGRNKDSGHEAGPMLIETDSEDDARMQAAEVGMEVDKVECVRRRPNTTEDDLSEDIAIVMRGEQSMTRVLVKRVGRDLAFLIPFSLFIFWEVGLLGEEWTTFVFAPLVMVMLVCVCEGLRLWFATGTITRDKAPATQE